MAESLQLPIIDLTSPDRISTARAIRQACVEVGFFYLINHGVEEKLFKKVLEHSQKYFSLSVEEKMKLVRRNNRGYTPLYAENLDPSSGTQGDSKESFYIGSLEDKRAVSNLNQWPAKGELRLSEQVVYGASAHSDYGMLTLLATDGVGGLQVCREKFKRPQIWEDVHHLSGAFIVNIGDMMERWTNCLFRSTLHRVMPTGQERFSMAFFLEPNPDCVVECLKSCCSDSSPPRFSPIRAGDYLEERFKVTYAS